jgi:hypothetical protein
MEKAMADHDYDSHAPAAETGSTEPRLAQEVPDTASESPAPEPASKPNGGGELLLPPHRLHIRAFVLTLFRYATPGNWVSLRTFFEDGAGLPPFNITPVKLNGDLDALVDQAYHLAERAARAEEKVVFCPPIATFTNNRHARQKNLAEGLALSVECDAHARAAMVKLKRLLGPATVVVRSGGEWTDPDTGKVEPKLHLHYRLKVPARSKDEQAKLKQARGLAAAIVGADRSNVPMVHPIRWPGSMHRKGKPRLSRIIGGDFNAEIDLDAALGILRSVAGDGEPPVADQEEQQEISAAERERIRRLFGHIPLRAFGVGLETNLDELRSAVAAIPPEAIAKEPDWVDLARALAWEAKLCPERTEALWEILDAVSKTAPNYVKQDNRTKFERYIREAGNHETPITIATAFHMAREHGWQGRSAASAPEPELPAWNPAELKVSFANIPHRPWIYGTDLLRGEITVIGSPGGVGKTALVTGMTAVIVTNTELLHERVWGSDLKVLLISGEEGTPEINRRMWAFSLAHQITEQQLERLSVVGADDERARHISFLRTNERNTSLLDLNGLTALRSALDAIRPDVLVLDPLVTFCSGGNMNDNAVMAQVMRALKHLAVSFNCAILIVHHTRKGGEQGEAESISGAAAIVNLARRALMPVPMTRDEAQNLKILPSERGRYFRLVDAKRNYTPPSIDSPWYQLHSIDLSNPEPPIYPHGDNVQAVARVTLPLPETAAEAANNEKIHRAILDLVDRGKLVEGEWYPYSPNVSGAKNLRAVLDDAVTAVAASTAPRQWSPDDLIAVAGTAIEKMKGDGWLYADTIAKGRFHGSAALYVDWGKTPWPKTDDIYAAPPSAGGSDESSPDDEPEYLATDDFPTTEAGNPERG